MLVASLALGATIIAGKRYNSTLLDDLDFTPASDHWSLPPQSSIDASQNENQALITIEYNKIDSKLSDEFEQSVHELGRILRSEGMAYWELFQDPADIGHYIEIRIADTWTDHIRQHEYVTKNVQVMEDRIRALIKDCPQPIISHYIGKSHLAYGNMSTYNKTYVLDLSYFIAVYCSKKSYLSHKDMVIILE
jgi:hypothetical protein